MRQLWMLLAIGSLSVLTACADKGFERDGRTVTYSYNAAADYDQAVEKADDYCEDRYGGEVGYSGNAEIVDQSEDDGAYELTFICK
jgi:hypothetical protein